MVFLREGDAGEEMAAAQRAGRAAEGYEEPPPLLLWSTPGREPGHGGCYCRTGQWDFNIPCSSLTKSLISFVFCVGLPINAISGGSNACASLKARAVSGVWFTKIA